LLATSPVTIDSTQPLPSRNWFKKARA